MLILKICQRYEENNQREGYWSLDWGVEFVVATYGLLGGVSVALTMVPTKTSSDQKRWLKRFVTENITVNLKSSRRSILQHPNYERCMCNTHSVSYMMVYHAVWFIRNKYCKYCNQDPVEISEWFSNLLFWFYPPILPLPSLLTRSRMI